MQCPSCGKELAEGSISCPYCFKQFNAPAQGAAAAADDFSLQFNRATTLWKDNLGDLALFTFVFLCVSLVPIASIGFFAGYVRGLIGLTRGEKPKIGDLFSAWDCFVNLLVYGLIFIAVAIIAFFIPIVGPLLFLAAIIFGAPGIYQVIDRNMNAIDALKWSINTVQRNFVSWLLAFLVGGVLSTIGVLALFIGVIFTNSWGALLIIQQYEQRKDDSLPASAV